MSWISSSVDPSFSLQETLVRSARPTAASTHLMEHEEEEQPASGAEERGHVERRRARRLGRSCFRGRGGIMRRGVAALVGGLGRIGGLVEVAEAGRTGGTEGEADAFGGREG